MVREGKNIKVGDIGDLYRFFILYSLFFRSKIFASTEFHLFISGLPLASTIIISNYLSMFSFIIIYIIY